MVSRFRTGAARGLRPSAAPRGAVVDASCRPVTDRISEARDGQRIGRYGRVRRRHIESGAYVPPARFSGAVMTIINRGPFIVRQAVGGGAAVRRRLFGSLISDGS